jgi:alkylated DNA repair dioxygenase AlkB
MDHIKTGMIFNNSTDLLFQRLWNTIEQDNNLIRGRNYRNHLATWYGSTNYAYTGIEHQAQEMPIEFQAMARQLENDLNYLEGYFNCLLINGLQNKGIAAHADNEPLFRCTDGTIGAVATISFGASATITISRNDRTEPKISFKTRNGEFYLMPEGRFQHQYKHSVSYPEPLENSSTRRISLSFRHLPMEI